MAKWESIDIVQDHRMIESPAAENTEEKDPSPDLPKNDTETEEKTRISSPRNGKTLPKGIETIDDSEF